MGISVRLEEEKTAFIMQLFAVLFIASLAAANAVPVTKTTYTNYIVSTFTGDIPDADSDSDVYITIFGTNGLSCYAHLENDHNNFETGLIDTFSILCPYLGPLHFASLIRTIVAVDQSGT